MAAASSRLVGSLPPSLPLGSPSTEEAPDGPASEKSASPGAASVSGPASGSTLALETSAALCPAAVEGRAPSALFCSAAGFGFRCHALGSFDGLGLPSRNTWKSSDTGVIDTASGFLLSSLISAYASV